MICKCGHFKQEHMHFPDEEHDGYIGECDHNHGAIWKDMCRCWYYKAMTNLEYLEYQYEQQRKEVVK